MANVFRSAALCLLASTPAAQQVGTHVAEEHPELPLWECDAGGCTKETKSVVLDSNWRWIHNGQYTNCYKDGDWDKTLCPDPQTCAQNCHMDGAGVREYASTYGIHANGNGLTLDFVTDTEYGSNYGSRVYLMDNEREYKMFKLKNREFTLTVDMARMPCGLNGAVYFVEMEQDGGIGSSGGSNQAGAMYGTGYCDAQCPHDMKFINGEANTIDWNATSDPPIGKYGSCCAEMDIWEANSRATAYTPHPCSKTGLYKCEGKECGDNDKDERYDGVCDKDGCDFNSWRLGNHTYYGRNVAGADFTVDSKKKLTVVTQFVTHDGTDTGDLVDIKRFYVQEGKTIENSFSSIAGVTGNSVTDELCNEMKDAFNDINDFKLKGGLKAMGDALDRGMVLVMSLWDDSLANMLWLDSRYPTDAPEGTPGVDRGPCFTDTGAPSYLRKKYPSASVTYSNIKVGPIGSTLQNGNGGNDGDDDEFGGNRRLNEVLV
eukprot:gb/GFBE01004508.1/.p1 GENE.gb/GFBE01004508.1/~~gb/GFBE01004508.1/.p1  ORF type:complete len:487 (+),score=111.13 gb/GFBE01004508.1/:1-1461(+)